jgi:hypothetical protein
MEIIFIEVCIQNCKLYVFSVFTEFFVVARPLLSTGVVPRNQLHCLFTGGTESEEVNFYVVTSTFPATYKKRVSTCSQFSMNFV